MLFMSKTSYIILLKLVDMFTAIQDYSSLLRYLLLHYGSLQSKQFGTSGLSHPFLGMGPGPMELGKLAAF